jgi:large subunit ribosomal protein L22
MGYQMAKPEGKVARAHGNEMRTSWKNAINVARAIKGLDVRKAEALLEDVIALRRPVKFTVRNRKVAAKPGIGRGRFPVKSAEATLYVLRNAINNAEYAGHDPDNMVVYHASAYKGRTLKGFMPRAQGRATAKNEDTTHIEIILMERAEEEGGRAKPATRAKAKAGTPAEAKETAEPSPSPEAATPKAEKPKAEKPKAEKAEGAAEKPKAAPAPAEKKPETPKEAKQ